MPLLKTTMKIASITVRTFVFDEVIPDKVELRFEIRDREEKLYHDIQIIDHDDLKCRFDELFEIAKQRLKILMES